MLVSKQPVIFVGLVIHSPTPANVIICELA